MSRRLLAAIALIAACAPALAQLPTANANSYELDNGIESFAIFVADDDADARHEVPGDGIVNGSANDQMFYEILPKELLNASNGTAPGTMELVSLEVGLMHSFFGICAGSGTSPRLWDMSLHSVTYTNPVSGVANDGRRYPDLGVAPLVTIAGGAIALPPPPACPVPVLSTPFYLLAIELGDATPGSGIVVPADGATDVAWCLWQPGGMSTLPADPCGCEMGGNLSMMTMFTTDERIPAGVTFGSSTAPVAANRNPFHGFRISTTNLNNTNRFQGFHGWPGFREPILQFRYLSTTNQPSSMTGPERGSGSLFMDATGTDVLHTGTRTCASGHLGKTVVHLATANPAAFPLLAQPGMLVTPTSHLLLDPGDPLFYVLTPAWDGMLVSNTTDYHFPEKHVYDSPLNFSFAGPIAPPGIRFYIQAFIVNFASGPPYSIVSTNAAQGTIY